MKKNILGSFVLVVSLAAGAGGCVVRGSGYVSGPTVEIYEEPPPPRVVTVTPRAGYVWIDGRWDWRGGRYVWLDGRWERERVGYYYTQGRWDRRGRNHVWVEGRWTAGNRNNGPVIRDHRNNRPPPQRPNNGPIIRDHRR
jgi:hypothetical protein